MGIAVPLQSLRAGAECRGDGLGGHVVGGHGSDLPFAHHGQDLVAGDRPTRGLDALEPEPRPDQPLDATAILFNNATEMLDLTELGEAPQLAVLLQRLAEETPSGGIALGAEQKVDRLPTRIDGAVQPRTCGPFSPTPTL